MSAIPSNRYYSDYSDSHSGINSDAEADAIAFELLLDEVPTDSIDSVLARCCIPPTCRVVELVLQHYSDSSKYPEPAIRFFRWSSQSVIQTSNSWRLMVEMLAETRRFKSMWDAIRHLKAQNALTLRTFTSVFDYYCEAGKMKNAIKTFGIMDRYGVPQDTKAMNSLLDSIYHGGRTSDAADFFDKVKGDIKPDRETFLSLLEGWNNEGNVARAKITFWEMVDTLGWSEVDTCVLDVFLQTLACGPESDEAVQFLEVMTTKKYLPSSKFWRLALDIIEKGTHVSALALWNTMIGESGFVPDINAYTAMISLLCQKSDIKSAFELFDGMPYVGLFPSFAIYNDIFNCLVKNKRATEVESFFVEMRKNELVPSPSSCAAAIKMFFAEDNSVAAFNVWNCMLEEHVESLEEIVLELLLGLLRFDRLGEIRRLVKDFHGKGIRLEPLTMKMLKKAFCDNGKQDTYDQIEQLLKPQ